MYEFITGPVVEINPAFVVIQAGGLGYIVHISLFTYTQLSNRELHPEGQPVKVFLHQVIREDAHLLFGFYSTREREIFRLLISVSGIGANTARMILSSMNPPELQKAIADGNVTLLKGVKGIGLKTAQRIIVDLKDKIGLDGLADEKFLKADNTIKEEALSALVTLGFAKSTVEKMLDKFIASHPHANVEELIRQTLKSI